LNVTVVVTPHRMHSNALSPPPHSHPLPTFPLTPSLTLPSLTPPTATNHPGCTGDLYVDPGGFCQGAGTTMYMQGFVSYVTGSYRTSDGSETPQCLSLWFQDWVLDTEIKFAAACLGCFLLGELHVTRYTLHVMRVTRYASYTLSGY
jgi:hypothetical protein